MEKTKEIVKTISISQAMKIACVMKKTKEIVKTINTSQAMKIAKEHGTAVTRVTMITWCKRYNIGCKLIGRWHIDKEALLSVLKGEFIEEEL